MRNLLLDFLVLLMFASVGAMAFSVIRRSRAGEIEPPRCPSCGRPVSKAYSSCPHCGEPREGTFTGVDYEPGSDSGVSKDDDEVRD